MASLTLLLLQRLRSYSSSTSASSLSKSKVDYSSSCLVNYLVNSLGFSKQQSLSNYAKIAKSVGAKNAIHSYTSFFENADSVIHFFKQHDFELSHIRKLVCYHPPLLSANVDKTLKPKFQILQELGFSGSDFVHAIAQNPSLLGFRLNPPIKTLRAVLGSDENVITVLKRSKWMQLSNVTKYLIPNVKLLEDYGVPFERIQRHVLQKPTVFVHKTELFLQIMIRVEKELGIPRDSNMFLSGICALFKIDDKLLELKVKVFKSFGWTRSDVMALIRRNPNCLNFSEANIRNKLQFFMNELGYDCAYLLSRFFMLFCSLEKRVLPRYKILQFLKEKGLIRMDYALYNTLCMSEPKFVKVIVLPFKEVHQVYAELTGRTLKMLPEGQTCEDAIKF